MSDFWTSQIAVLAQRLGPQAYAAELRKLGLEPPDEDARFQAAAMYTAYPMFLFCAVMCSELFGHDDPQRALNGMEADLNQLWQGLIDDRSTEGLSDAELEADEALLERLEFLKDSASGLLAIWRQYAAGDDDPARDANALVEQAVRLTASDLPRALALWGQAGATALRGGPYWPLWDLEIDEPPAAGWAFAVRAMHKFLADNDLYPLAPFAAQREVMSARREARAQQPASLDAPDDAFERPLTPETRRLMDVLLCGKQELSARQKKSLPPFTPEVVRQLIHVLESGDYDDDDSPGQGWAPIHAARLLGESKAPAAIVPFIRIAELNDYDTYLYSAALFGLRDIGPPALPVILDTYRYSTNPELKSALAEAVGRVGRGDERAFRALEAYYYESSWADDRMLAVMGLADYGGPRVIELFKRALKSDRDIKPEGIREIVAALEELEPGADPVQLRQLQELATRRYDNRYVRFDSGGAAYCRDCGALMERSLLGEWQHVDEADEPRRASRLPILDSLPPAPPPEPRYSGIGRNELCPCGSGRKFKHCHGAPKPTVH